MPLLARTPAASPGFFERSNSSAAARARPAACAVRRNGAVDLAGKAYGVPVWQMLGGKVRDKIRCYADTTESHDPKVFGQRLKARQEEGFAWAQNGPRHRPVAWYTRHAHPSASA